MKKESKKEEKFNPKEFLKITEYLWTSNQSHQRGIPIGRSLNVPKNTRIGYCDKIKM